MRILPLVPAALCAALALAGCDRGEPEPPARPAEEAPAAAPPPARVEAPPPAAPAAAPPRRRSAREVRDGPGEDAAPEYAGARGAATSLPSGDDDAAAPANSTSDAPRSTSPRDPSRDAPRDPPVG